MNFRPARRDDPDLNLTPLIDVVFLLLIFFMVSTTFDRNSMISITLPESSRENTELAPEIVDVAIDSDGKIYINDKLLINSGAETIRQALTEASSGLSDPMVIINADANATHQSVISVMDAARRSALNRITFATRTIDEEPGE